MNNDSNAKPINWLSREAVPEHVSQESVHKLSTNENPLGPSPAAIEAIRNFAPALAEYPPTGDGSLRQVLAEIHGKGLTPDHFFTTSSGSEGLEYIGRAFLRPGDECIICSPAFSVYNWAAGLQNASLVDVPLDPEKLTHRIDAILNAITEKTRLLFLSNPHNPAGTIISRDDMERLYSELPEHVTVVSDEVYIHYVDDPQYPDSVEDMFQGRNVVMLYSFSKAYGLAGMRLGYGIARPDLAARVAAFRRTFHLGTLVMEAGMAALQDTDHLQESVTLAQTGRSWLYKQLDRLGLHTWPSQSNFILVRLPVPAYEVAVRLLDYGVIVMPQAKSSMPDCIRVSIGLQEGNEAFIVALEQILGGTPG
ncbi:MAG: aminotransferase class I/II-fold pyridoxal phosphate-dependent enzyme [Candidatus Latescibacteria bacterium]|jgi:histidinol-phosphate aminotransferase|nr:aminotransferase class I/II-fold pyridoxal phosphate-dependent enzyme [Candidatus Latescibacterota bacterium]